MTFGISSISSKKDCGLESSLMLQNVEALTEGEVTLVGCKQLHGATCYVFDGNGNLIDRQEDQYPGNL